jgi:hypothetical protein
MKEKVDVWIVVRFDGIGPEQENTVGIKGVYDSPEDANAAVDRAVKESEQRPHYSVIRSRRFPGDSVKTETHLDHQARLEKSLKMWQETVRLVPELMKPALMDLVKHLPSQVWRRTLQPLLSHYAEALVAIALSASPIQESDDQGDLRLPDGSAVEVKAILLDRSRPKAPSVQYRPDQVQFLALILFSADLKTVGARLIPSSVLSRFDRPGPISHHVRFSNLRITPDLINAPGTSDIELPTMSSVPSPKDVVITEIKNAVHDATRTKQKIAMFHFQVLKHADALDGLNAKALCKE